jgi:hypothetical protein
MSGGFVYASANNPNGAGTIGGVTYFGAKELTTETFTATGASSLASLAVSGTTTLTSLAVSGVSTLASVSASALFGPAFEEDCSGASDKVLYNATTGHFSCGVDVGASGGGARRGGVAGRVDEPSQLTLIVECVDAIGDGDGGGVLGDGGQVDRLGAACEQGGGEAKAEKIDQRSHGHSLHCGPFDEGPGCCASALV